MPAKKAAAKKKKTSKKVARRGPARRKAVAKKKAKKKAKQATGRKKTARKKVTKKKPKKKTTVKKKKKVAKKASTTKKSARKKKAAKRTAKKAPSKVTAKRKLSGKKGIVAKKASTKKRRVATKATAGRTRSSAKSTGSTRSRAARTPNLLTGPVRGFKPYLPRRGEAYMSDKQLKHFRELLNAWKRELMEEVDRTMLHMKDDAANFPDPNDRATQESEFGLELRTRDRERKLLKKIDSALQRIEDGSYGFCEETGDEIGLRRLEARPVATLCVEAQERRELAERQFRDREDHYR